MIDFLSFHNGRNQLIATIIAAEAKHGHSQLVLVSRVKHIKILKEILAEKGINAITLSGDTKGTEREKSLDAMRTGKQKVLIATFSLAKEGLDIPKLNRLHLTTPQKNKAIVKQSAGRIERNIEGKSQPIIFDYVDEEIDYCYSMYKKRKGILK